MQHILQSFTQTICDFGWLGWWEISSAVLVAFGCLGELWIILNKLTRHIEVIPRTSSALWRSLAWLDATFRPVAVRLKIGGRKIPESKEQLLERFCVALVAVGVGSELFALFFSIPESVRVAKIAARANERASLTESNNLVLRSNLVTLEMKLQPRTITRSQKQKFETLLKDWPKCPVTFHCGNVDNETRNYTEDLRELFDATGFDVKNGVVFDLGNSFRASGKVSQLTLICVVTNLPATPPLFPWEDWGVRRSDFPYYMNDMEPISFIKVKMALWEIGVPVLDAAVPFREAFPEPVRKRVGTNITTPPVPVLPGEIAIIVSEKLY